MRDFFAANREECQDRLKRFYKGEPVFPIQMEIFPTEICNHGCLWCVSAHYRAPGRVLEWDHLREFIVEAHDNGLREVHICGGGEPLVYPHIQELIELCERLTLRLLLYTNGSILKDELIEAIARTAFEVRISLDAGNEQTYAQVRQTDPKAFARTITFIQKLVDTRRGSVEPKISLSFVADDLNVQSIPEYIRLASSLGVDEALLKTNLFLDDQTREKQLETMISMATDELGHWPDPSVRAYDAPSDTFTDGHDDIWASVALKAVLHSNWDVYPCCHSGGKSIHKRGNLMQNGIQGVFYSPESLELLRGIAFGDASKCDKCVHSSINRQAKDYLHIPENKQRVFR